MRAKAAGPAMMKTMRADTSIPKQIVELIQREAWGVGSHLPAQMLADRLRVSRQPVNDALSLLHEKGLLTHERNRGYFVAQAVDEPLADVISHLGLAESDVVTSVYFRIAEDLLQNQLPQAFTEQLIRHRYGLTAAQLNAVLGRIANEGWAERKPGYGWEFSTMLLTPDSLLQSYRLRLALEPAALLEPGFRLERTVLERCRATELRLLDGGIDTATADELHDRGVQFHESLVQASHNRSSSTPSAASTACAGSCPTGRCGSANATPNTAASTCTCWNCWSANAMTKRPPSCANTCSTPCNRWRKSKTSCNHRGPAPPHKP
jgi:DNA-binding GntR family transcriptional regulator